MAIPRLDLAAMAANGHPAAAAAASTMLLMPGVDVTLDVWEEEEAAAAAIGWSGIAQLRRAWGRTSSRTSMTSRTTAAVASLPTYHWRGRTRRGGRLRAGCLAVGDFRGSFFIFGFSFGAGSII